MVVGPHLHHVADIDRECAGDGRDVVPLAFAIDLEPADPVLEQHGKRARVAMMVNAEVRSIAELSRQRIAGRIEIQPQVAGMRRGECAMERAA